jgi:hypothetical protein
MSSAERQLGVDLFNEVWRLMETREDDDRMLHATQAMAYHWGEAPECLPENRAGGVAGLAGLLRARPGRAGGAARAAMLEWCESAGLRDWDLAYAYEALARAHAVAGSPEAADWKAKAREVGDAIARCGERRPPGDGGRGEAHLRRSVSGMRVP